MGSKRERQADRALVAAYHEARLAELLDHVAEAVDRFRAGELDAFAVDDVIHQHKRAARELWNFCWLAGAGAGVELTARLPRDMAAQDDAVAWWQRGAPRERERERSEVGARGRARAEGTPFSEATAGLRARGSAPGRPGSGQMTTGDGAPERRESYTGSELGLVPDRQWAARRRTLMTLEWVLAPVRGRAAHHDHHAVVARMFQAFS